MADKRNSVFASIDWFAVFLYIVLVVTGILTIFSSKYSGDATSVLSSGTMSRSQAVYAAISLVIALLILLLEGSWFQRFAYPVYGLTMLMLAAVLVVGVEISGAKSWINLGSFSIQPSEFAKFGTALAVSKYVSSKGFYGQGFMKQLPVFLFILLSIALIMLEPDAGSAIVFLSFVIPLFREGFSMTLVIAILYLIAVSVIALLVDKYIMIAVIFALLLIGYVIFRKNKGILLTIIIIFIVSVGWIFAEQWAFDNILEQHQRDRIMVTLGKIEDNRGVGYNLYQSKIAIGSGHWVGKGFLQGTQTKMDFVPEQHTDFIFCTLAEETGFLGSFLLMALYFTLLIKLILMAERQRSPFSRIYGYCVVGILFFHVFINISMTIGLMPVIGIPLPFVSYGGSSLLATTILLFIFIKLDAYRYSILS